MTIPRHEAEAIALSLVIGKGVVIRDRQGIGSPVLGRIVSIRDEYTLVVTEAGVPLRFERSTGCAMQPGDHERWELCAPPAPGTPEYEALGERQDVLYDELKHIRQQIDVIGAVLETADEMACAARRNTP